MKPFLYMLVLSAIVGCNSMSPLCYMGVLPVQERAGFKDSINFKLDNVYQTKTLTETENTKQLDFFRSTISVAKKLKKVKNEVRARIKYVFPSKRIKTKRGKEVVSSGITCETIFIVTVRNGSYVINLPQFSYTNKRLQLLNEKNIDSITVLQGMTATAIYGTSGKCGIVILHSGDKKLKNELNRLEF